MVIKFFAIAAIIVWAVYMVCSLFLRARRVDQRLMKMEADLKKLPGSASPSDQV